VADLGGRNGPNGLSVIVERIDPSTNQVTRSIGVPGAFGLTPAGLAVADGSLWMSSSATLFRIDPLAGRLVKRIDLDGTAGEVVPNDPAGSVWVTSETSGGLVGHATEVDTATGRVRNSVTVGCCPGHIAVGNGFVWVTDASKGSVDLISETTGDLSASVPVGQMPSSIALANGAVWVTVDSR
jgi:streptogramin lyase